jgi:acetyl esterase/lipase
MKRKIFTVLVLLLPAFTFAQQVIPLYPGAAPGSESWTYNEQEYTLRGEPIVYNVSHPTLTVYQPNPAIATGTAVIVCPGGGFTILRVRDEGTDVAKYLNQKGVTVFLLKYRTARSFTDNPALELTKNMLKKGFFDTIKAAGVVAIADGREAIKYVRAHAAEYHVSPSRVGIMGFSAGGIMSAASGFNYTTDDRPDFVAPIYCAFYPEISGPVNADEPPFFIAAASDDELGLAASSVDLYSKLLAAKKSAELDIYAKGHHGFGMVKHNIPTDTWYERYGDWLGMLGLLKPAQGK